MLSIRAVGATNVVFKLRTLARQIIKAKGNGAYFYQEDQKSGLRQVAGKAWLVLDAAGWQGKVFQRSVVVTGTH